MDVLLVEPEPAMSAVLQSVLESRGHTVTAVTDGESGLERYQCRHFPIVILDWQLPEMDGLEVCRKIRGSPKGADSLILMITLRTNPGDLKQILAAGADDYLAKPVDQRHLNIRLAIAEQRASNLMLQRKAEESRARAQTMLQLVLNTIPSRVFWKNKESRYLGCNRLFALDAGLKDPSQIVGKTDHDLCWAKQAQLYLSDDRAVMQSGLPKVNYEEHQATPDGESMYLEASKIPLKDGKGNLIGVMGTYQDITKRKEAEDKILALNLSLEEQVRERTKELLAKEEQLHETLALNDSILMTSALGIAAYRQNGQCVMANPSLASIAGITQEQLLNQNFRQLGSWQTSGIQEAAESVLATGAKAELDIRSLTSFFGHDVWMRCRLSRFTSRGEPHLLLMLENITEKKAAEEELRLAASVYQNSSEGILVTDVTGIILSVNPAFTEITGYTEDEALGKKTTLLRSDRHGPEFYRSMWEALTKEGCWRGEIWNRRKDGEVYLEWLSINRIEASAGAPFRYVAVFHDITELRRKDEEIRHQAFHDTLTGLPNRALMKDRLLHALERAKREGGRLSVIFIDLDRFKAINDGLGHDVGDLLLQEVARRIKIRMRTVDTVARLGGDEFVVLMEDLRDAGDCASLAQELIAEIARPMKLSGHAVEISASMGMAFYPEDGANPLELMKCADLAMYAAKSAGRNTYRFFQQDMQDRISQRLTLEMELRLALVQRDLELHYQPKVDLATGNILGVEALLRWWHPLRGLLLPADFIPLAEECGLICELGDWVLDEVCHQSAVWQAAGHTFKIAFNISPHQLETGDLVARISELTALHGIAPSDLEIELTESAVMAYSIQAASVLARLRGIGVTVAVSDFCAGYSSLAYLRKLPIDILKINHSFVTDADSNAEDAQIVKTILALGRMFKLTMEAEGIETSHQAELLKSFGCGIAQGYFFSRPLPAQEFENWLDAKIDANGRASPSKQPLDTP
ncbi:hypothetical protein SCD_n01413 [Sulfuricella denitrificans skB26]|uniref:Uncharacterized protein n=1 Tax=Sulfuricella denitrificans (strain DSM 22764 / NBRC 105220 / skB26) TaxID=1163617 RepID=S6AKY6_SULDS|nr:EAL domain-containing protein [Sulfuricella denitrificans]BAN35239.1 hypothetical protein SCD_n01413 [Sulfuricella denitrificans skB26]